MIVEIVKFTQIHLNIAFSWRMIEILEMIKNDFLASDFSVIWIVISYHSVHRKEKNPKELFFFF